MPFDKVVSIMEDLTGRQFDPRVMAAFWKVVKRNRRVETLLAPEERRQAEARV
jgi:response regulator RpfG family c-di-GMP phosphodiesterase